MDALFVAIRSIHFAACMLLAGELLFVTVIAGSMWRRANVSDRSLDRHLRIVAVCTCTAMFASGMAWLLFEAASMSGTTVGRAMLDGSAGTVLRETSFGRVFALRGIVFVALAASLVAFVRVRHEERGRWLAWLPLVLATFELVTLAFAGHAGGANGGAAGLLHVGGDMVHLAAAGGWIGALPALVHCLGRPVPFAALARITRRFSLLGIGCVGLLIASGILNTLFLVGSVPALFGTHYGQWLLLKIAVFVAMLCLAAVNRLRWTPRIERRDVKGVAGLRRNATLETAEGLAIIAIVGALGTMVPGAHQSPVWPFAYTLDVSSSSIAIEPAFPTTYATSPVPYTVDTVAQGSITYASHCGRCHGTDGHGDGPDAASLARQPPDLGEHALHHRPGDLFWWIAHGIPGTPMPAFSPPLSDTSVWQVVQYLFVRANAESAMSIGPDVDVRATTEPPDFSYEAPAGGQRTLRGEGAPMLVVLFTTQASAHRLEELARDTRLKRTRLRIVGMSRDEGALEPGERVHVEANAAPVYALFAMTRNAKAAAHAELLIDEAGFLRARWLGLPEPGTDRDAQIIAALDRLPAAAPKRAPSHHHGH